MRKEGGVVERGVVERDVVERDLRARFRRGGVFRGRVAGFFARRSARGAPAPETRPEVAFHHASSNAVLDSLLVTPDEQAGSRGGWNPRVRFSILD